MHRCFPGFSALFQSHLPKMHLRRPSPGVSSVSVRLHSDYQAHRWSTNAHPRLLVHGPVLPYRKLALGGHYSQVYSTLLPPAFGKKSLTGSKNGHVVWRSGSGMSQEYGIDYAATEYSAQFSSLPCEPPKPASYDGRISLQAHIVVEHVLAG